MGSVVEEIECHNCGLPAVSDFRYKTGEETQYCKHCGYTYSGYWRRDDEGNLILKDPNEKAEPKNLYFDERIVDKPFGAYEVKAESGMSQIGTLEDQDHYEQFNKDIRQLIETPDNEILYVVIRRYVDENHLEFPIYKQNENIIIE